MLKKILMLVAAAAVGSLATFETLYQLDRRTKRKPMTDEQLELVQTWCQTELMGRWQNEQLDNSSYKVNGTTILTDPPEDEEPLTEWEQQIIDGIDPGAF